MTNVWWTEAATAIGSVGLASTEGGLVGLFLPRELAERDRRLGRLLGAVNLRDDDGRNDEPRRQLDAYLDGARRGFDLPLDRRGSAFQLATWAAVSQVPFGRTASYRDIATRIGAARAVRAVGAANGDNPLPIVVPCHRIVGSAGDLTGYAGGVELKRRLLALEGAMPAADDLWDRWAAGRLAAQPDLLIGPRSTRIFCRPTCRYTPRLKRAPALFNGAAEAIRKGYRACKVCRPV